LREQEDNTAIRLQQALVDLKVYFTLIISFQLYDNRVAIY
jgi:hypothetical protein